MNYDTASIGSNERFLEETRDASPANLLIKIESFSLFSKYGIDKYESREFEAGGYKWKLIIYPDGIENEKDNCHVSMYLSIAEIGSLAVGWEVNAVFAFFVYDQLMDNYLCFRGTARRFNALVPKWGFSKMISKQSLMDPSKGYVVGDNCVFGAEVLVIKPQRINESLSLIKDTSSFKRDWKISNFSKLENVWISEEFKVGDQKWAVKLYPKGNSSRAKDRGYVSLFAECVDSRDFPPHHKVKAEVTLRMKNKLNDTDHSEKLDNWFTSASPNWGYIEYIPIADMSSRGFLVDDCCFLEVEITVQALALDAPKI